MSMELHNDPRFFTVNVIDRRLTALASLSVVSGIMAGAAVDQCFALRKDFVLFDDSHWYKINVYDWMQLIGFLGMCVVLAVNVTTSLVFGIQFFYTFRLMTGGPTGFETAKAYWRQLSATALTEGMPLFSLGVGLMLFTNC